MTNHPLTQELTESQNRKTETTMDKKLIYKVFLREDYQEGESLEYANIYSDGSFDITYNRHQRLWFNAKAPELAYLEPEEWAIENDRGQKERVEDYLHTMNTWNDRGCLYGCDEDGWILINDREPDAFRTLCAVTREHNEDAIPPYKNSEFTIEYFGEGEPWERDPEFDPDAPIIMC